MTKLCARGKAAAKRKFRVYPSAYANAYASKICAGKIKDPSGLKRKDFKGPKPAGKKVGGEVKKAVIGTMVQKLAKKVFGKGSKTAEAKPNNSSSFMGSRLVDLYQKNVEPLKAKVGKEAKIKEVISGLKKASRTHAAQAKTLSTIKLNKGGGKDMGAKKKNKKKYDNNLEDLPRGLQIDTTTDKTGSAAKKMMFGGEVRGAGAAIRGMGFKGVF
jgi:hypothetical protein